MKDPDNKKKLNKSEEATVAGGDWMQPIHDFGKNLNPPHDPSQPTLAIAEEEEAEDEDAGDDEQD